MCVPSERCTPLHSKHIITPARFNEQKKKHVVGVVGELHVHRYTHTHIHTSYVNTQTQTLSTHSLTHLDYRRPNQDRACRNRRRNNSPATASAWCCRGVCVHPPRRCRCRQCPRSLKKNKAILLLALFIVMIIAVVAVIIIHAVCMRACACVSERE